MQHLPGRLSQDLFDQMTSINNIILSINVTLYVTFRTYKNRVGGQVFPHFRAQLVRYINCTCCNKIIHLLDKQEQTVKMANNHQTTDKNKNKVD